MCGRYEHKKGECPLRMHPDVNTDPTLTQSDSIAGKAWDKKGYKFIPNSVVNNTMRLSAMPQAGAKPTDKQSGSSKDRKDTEKT